MKKINAVKLTSNLLFKVLQTLLAWGEKKITIDNIGKYYDLLVDIKAAEKALTDVNSETDNIKGIDVDNAKKQWEKYTTSYNSKLEILNP